MDVNERLRKMLQERGLTTYKMAELSGLSHTTLANVFKRNTVPSISTLQAICKGFGITLSQFFAEGEMVEMTPELKELFDGWVNLNPEQKAAVQQMIYVCRPLRRLFLILFYCISPSVVIFICILVFKVFRID